MYKKMKKIIASVVVLMMMVAHINTLGIGIGEVLAAELSSQNSKTKNANIEFDSYFIVDENKTYEATKNIGEDNKVVAKISVKNAGYLKNANISFNDSNFNIINKIESDKIANVDEKNNSIALNQIDGGEDITLEIPFTLKHDESFNISKLSNVNTAKFTGTYVDGKGKENKIEKDIKLELKWTASAESVLESNITKYVPYDVNEQKGLIVELNVNSYVKDNLLPIKENNIEILMPRINEILPEKVSVRANNTNFEYNYDEETGIVTIKEKNEANENGDIVWKNDGRFTVTLNYSEETIEEFGEEGINIDINASSKISTYSYDEKELEKSIENKINIKEKLGDIVDFDIKTSESLSKGYMYVNYKTNKKIETTYDENVIVNVSMPELTDSIVIKNSSDKFITEKSEFESDTYYKNIKLNKDELIAVLGEEGTVKVNETEINLNEENDENEIIIDLDTENVTVETSKPVAEGKLEIRFEKAIKAEIEYKESELKQFNKMNISVNAVATSGDTEIINKEVNKEINLIEPKTNAELVLNTSNLSTVIKNTNVEFKVVLDTNSLNNKLYSNPTITIDLPSYIEKIDIRDVSLAFEKELKVEDSKVVTLENGRKQIIVTLSGTQTKYSIDSVTGGANLIITADMTINKLTPNKTEEAILTCVNGEEQVTKTVKVNFVAPSGIVTVNKISNYVDGAEVLALTENKEEEIEIQASSKNITAEIQVINNYSNIIKNVRILGRTLAKGTTNTANNNDLENTFDAPMLGAIESDGEENVSIYYSENGAATGDLSDVNNNWKLEVKDFSKIKSYLIVLNDYTMNIGDTVKFTYGMQIPANLDYSEKVSSVYTVYFDNVQKEQTIADKANSCLVTLGTGAAPELQVELKSNSLENSVVREGQYVKFIASIKNTGSVDAQNVKLNIKAPTDKLYTYRDGLNIMFTKDLNSITDPEKQLTVEYGTIHTEYKEENFFTGYDDSEDKNPDKTINVGTVKAGETKEIVYELKVDKIKTHEENLYTNGNRVNLPKIEISNKVSITADDLEGKVESEEYKLEIGKAGVQLVSSADKTSDYSLIKGQEIEYYTRVEQTNEVNLQNVVIKAKIPQGLKIKESKIEDIAASDFEIQYTTSVNSSTGEVIFNINELPVGAIINCIVKTEVQDIIGDIQMFATSDINGIGMHYSNIVKNKVSKLSFTIEQKALESQYVKEKEEITYTYEIENTSDIYTNSFTFENKIPDGMKFVKAIIVRADGDEQEITNPQTSDKYILELNSFKAEQKITIKVVMEADFLEDGMTEKEISNYATIYGDYFETLNSNSVKTTIEYNKDAHKIIDEDVIEDDTKEGRYIITGVAWLDENANGQRDQDENPITGVEVRLLNKATNEIIKDADSGKDKISTTSSAGEYRFTNLEEGEYLVVFNYNSAKYNLTVYQKSGISNSVNSDGINIEMNIDGETKTVAVSDTIKITNSNIRNIDIGLIESQRSDLRLDKYISKITLTYGNTVKTYDHKNVKLAKVEIPAKELSNATVIVEYKITVTNEGGIPNYVRKIVDYIPKDMKFSSELNKDWYQSSNGDIYNSSLSNTKIESGETVEVTLQLTRKMTDTNTGIVNNNAELYEVYNEEGINDADSTPANKISGEDDMSAADVVISVKTGDAIIYTLILSTVICVIMGISIYYIRKFVLRRM